MSGCPKCGSGNWVVVDTNGAEFPETLVEQAECNQCGHEFTNVLTA